MYGWSFVAELSMSGAWLIVLFLLTFCVWKRVGHWSSRVLLYSVALMALLRMAFMARVLLFYVFSMEEQGLYVALKAFVLVGNPLAYSVGIVGGVGALVALRKKAWGIQALRNPTEAAQPQKGA